MGERPEGSAGGHPGEGLPGGERDAVDLLSEVTGPLFDYYDGVIRGALAGSPIQQSDRDDCRQEVWHEVLATRLGGFRGGDLRAWLTRVARNRAADVGRRARRAPVVEASGEIPRIEGPRGSAHLDACRALVWSTLATLERRVHPRSFLVFFLRGIEGWSFGEIGEALGLTPSQARLRHHRAKRIFRDAFADEGAIG